MKKILFLLFVIISFASFGQVPDTSRAKKVYGNMMWVKYDTTAATWDTLGIFPGATPELWSSSGLNHTFIDTGYVKTTGDTLYGAYLFKSNTAATMSFYQALGWWTGSDGIETNTIMAGDYFSVQRLGGGGNIISYLFRNYLRFSDSNLGLDIYYKADSMQTGSNFVFDMPTAKFTGDLYISERINGLYYQSDSTNLVNGDSAVLTDGISGWGEVYAFNAGAIDEWAEFIISSDGAVLLKSNSTDVVNTDTADKLCIFDNGSGVTIRNRLGGTRTIKYIIHH